jgi:hypothetical protein
VDSRLARGTAVAVAALAAALVPSGTAAAHVERPDLVVTKLSNPPATIGTGGTLRLSDRTANRGAGVARRSTTRYFIARSAAGQIDDEKGIALQGGRTIEALGPGDSSGAPRDLVIPDVPAGTYDVVACADSRRRVPESNEGNNCRAAARLMRVRDNALPVVFIGGGAATGAVVAENEAGLLAPALTITDDEARLTLAMVASGAALGAGVGGFVATQYHDYLFVNQLGITGTYNSGTGVLTLRGSAPVAAYQSALRSVFYRYLGDDPKGAERAEIRVRDSLGAWSKPVRQTITVTPVNDAPVVTSAGNSESPRMFASTLALWDPDSEIGGATVRIASGWGASEIDLKAVTPQGITNGGYNSGTGVLTLTGTASVSDYQAALRSVELTKAPSGKGPGTFEVKVTDAQGAASNGFLMPVEELPF